MDDGRAMAYKASGIQISVTADTFDILKVTGRFQYEWTHEIEPTHSDLGPRLNATFRSVEKHHYKCPSYKK